MAHKTKMRLLQISGGLDSGTSSAFAFVDGSGTSNQSYLKFDTRAGYNVLSAPTIHSSSLTVGIDDTGHDVKFFGATTGKSLLWDESEDSLVITGDAADALKVAGGVDIDGVIAVGVDNTGYDVQFFGATTGKSMLWDQSEDSLVITGDANDALKVAGGVDIDGVINVGTNQDGYDVKFFGNTTNEYMLWDESADELVLALTSKLSFHDAGGGENIVAGGDGVLTINAGTSLTTTAPTQTLTADTVNVESLNPSDPLFLVKNTNADAGGARIRLAKDGASAADDDVLGELQFWGEDAGGAVQEFGNIQVQSSAITAGSETGKMIFGLASSDDGGVDTVLTIAAGADAAGSTMTVAGDLVVHGTTTTIESTTLTVTDKNIEMGVVDNPSDNTADGGGITLKGATDKTIIWDDANDNWTSNQDWNIATGKKYKINNAAVFDDATTITSTVTSAAGLTTVAALGAGGSIATGFGNIDNGTSNLTCGGVISQGVDATGTGNNLKGAAGTLNLGASNDLALYHDSANSFIVHQNTGDLFIETSAGGIVLDAEDDTLEIKYSGTLGATFGLTGLDLASGDVYKIDGTTLLSATALASTVTVSLPSLDIATATDIGEAAVDGDQLIVYNASATANRKMAMSRLSTFISAGSTSKAFYVVTASVPANTDVQIPGGIELSDWSNAASGSAEVYLNGQLLLSAAHLGVNYDYYQSVTAGVANPPGRVKFEFDIEENDVLQFILRS